MTFYILYHRKPICDALANYSSPSSSCSCSISIVFDVRLSYLCYQARQTRYPSNLDKSFRSDSTSLCVCVRVRESKSFVVYKNFMRMVLMVVAIAHQFNKNTSEVESFLHNFVRLLFHIWPWTFCRKVLENERSTRVWEKVWIGGRVWARKRLRWMRSRWKVPMEYEIRTLYKMICVWDWAVLALAQLHHRTMNSIRVCFIFFLSIFFLDFLLRPLCTDVASRLGIVLAQKAKVVVESKDPIKLNFGDKTRTMAAQMAYQWHTFLTQIK